MISNTIDHTFLSGLLRKNPVVLDFGGNQGEFARYVAQNFQARTWLYEPLPVLFRDIPDIPDMVKYPEAVAAQRGELTLKYSGKRCASLYEGYGEGEEFRVKSVDLATVFSRLPPGDADLVKMDIEGAEIELLETAPAEILGRVRQMTVEFHDFLYPELQPRVEAIKKRLAELGFYVINFSYHTNGDVLFVRKDVISFLQYLWLKYPLKYARGLGRILKRI